MTQKVLEVNGEKLTIKLSPTFIDKAACPRYLKLHYVDNVDDRLIRVAAERGSAVHAVLAELISICQEAQIQPSSLSLDQIAESVKKHTDHRILPETGEVLAWSRLWAERYQISKHLVGFEEKVGLDDEFDDTEWDNASYRGILDVIDINKNHLTVTDWKSQPHILNQSELDAHEQGTMYCWLASKQYPHIETFTFRIWYLRYGFYAETTRSMADLEAFERTLMIKEQKILEIDNWDAIPGKHCQYCDVIRHCDLAQDLSLTHTNIISQEQAINAARRITAMDVLSKELKGQLKNYVKENDSVVVGEGTNRWVWGFRSRESIYWKVDELAEVLAEHGHEFLEVANIDARKLKKLLKIAAKEDPGLEAGLAAIEKKKVKAEFKGYKQGDVADEEETEVE
jgi:hypothetical protein